MRKKQEKILAGCAAVVIVVGGCLAYLDSHPICGITEEDSAAMGEMIQRLERDKEAREKAAELAKNEEMAPIKTRIEEYCQVPSDVAQKLAGEVLAASHRFDIPAPLLCGIMIVESHGRRHAKNGACVGLMQVKAPVWRRELRSAGITDLYGVDAGAYVLSTYLRETGGNVRLALYRYSGGGGSWYVDRVRQAGGEWLE